MELFTIKGIRGKLLIPILSIVAVFISIAIIISFLSSKNALEDTIHSSIRQICISTISHLDSWVLRTQKDMKVWSDEKAVKEFFQAKEETKEAALDEVERIFQTFVKEYQFFELIAVTDTNGLTVAASQRSIIGKISVKDRKYFQKSISGTPFISDIIKSRSSGNPVFVISSPIRTDQGIVGIIMGVIDLNYFSKKFINKIKVGKTGYIYAYNKNGIMVSHPKKELIMKMDMHDFDFGKEMIKKKYGEIQYVFEEIEEVAAFQPVDSTEWTIVVTANTEESFASINSMLKINVGILVFSVLVVLLCISLIVGNILKPVRNIEIGIDRILKGDLKQRIEIVSSDEIGRIAKVLNELLDSFQAAISNIITVMKGVARGDLSKSVEGEYEGEIKILQSVIDESFSMLGKIIVQVISIIDQINTGTNELSRSAQSLASGTSSQAASVEQISSSMSEVGARAKNNNESATSAQSLAEQSLQAVQKGSLQMEGMSRSMSKIRETSNEVTKVVKVIEEIAFQTNLLALNAAVEAARAGKYGKGFAVVADEVRSLAGRSADAAKSTTELIGNSAKEVEKGVENAEQTAKALEEIIDLVEKMYDIIGKISATSSEQNNMTEEINKSLVEVNNVVQQNSAISEQTSSAVAELSNQALRLHDLIKNFELKEEDFAAFGLSDTEFKSEHEYDNQSELPANTFTEEQQPGPQAKIQSQPQHHVPQSGKPKIITLDDGDFGKY